MRYALAALVFASTTLTGCSLLYNPNDLPAQRDAMPDMQQIIDANPAALMLTNVTPDALLEGQGDGGSRRAILVIEGKDIAQTGVTVAIVPAAGETRVPMLTVDTAAMQIDAYGTHIAVPITVPVDTTLPKNVDIALDVRVTQDAFGTPITQTLTGRLVLRGFAEYDAIAPLDVEKNEFSRVMLTTGTLPRPSAGPVYISANASISIADAVMIDVGGGVITAGPNAGAGGMGGASNLLGDPGDPGEGPAAGLGGQAAGPWRGDDQLTTLKKNENRGSGGGGGASSTILSTRGGNGGGGGGSISLAAGGNLRVGTILAKGGLGETASVANPGGNGSGGAVLLRAGGNLDAGTLDVSGSNAGRARADAGGTRTGVADAYRGPSFITLPEVVNLASPMLEVTGGNSIVFQYILIHGDDNEGPFTLTMGTNGRRMFEPQVPLQQGSNEICLLVVNADPDSPTRNCATIAHIFKPVE